MNKKWKQILLIASSVLILGCMILVMVDSLRKEIIIEEPNTPLSATKTVTPTYTDSKVIPDKFNTGCILGEMTPVTKVGTVDGVQYTVYGSEGNGWLRLEFWKTNKSLGNDIVIKNCDFSSNKLIITYTEKLSEAKTVHFINCKFSSFTTSSSENLTLDFRNCEMIHFAGSNATLDSCFFGNGTMGDAIDPGNNCHFTNCFIADIQKKATTQETNHVDGVQFFCGNDNVSFENCRFEIPAIPYSATSGYLNCPVTFTLRSGNATNISFSNCYINGGSYYGIQFVSSKGYSFKNINFSNVSVGQTSKYAIDDEVGLNIASSIKSTDKLYIGSVWKANGKIHLSVSNDTNDIRTLLIKTNKEEKTVTIPACPKGLEIARDSMDYSDFPFDIDTTVGDADWVVCFDTTNGGDSQIRFVNWSGADVALEDIAPKKTESVIAPPVSKKLASSQASSKETVAGMSSTSKPATGGTLFSSAGVKGLSETNTKSQDKVVISGKCGDKATYELVGTTLTISGSGSTYNYNSSKTAPWYSMKSQIQTVVIGEGISKIGAALFLSCDKLTSVSIPEGVTAIDINAFNKCKLLTNVTIPASVTSIGKYAFAGSGLTSVNYNGLEKDWEKISFADNSGILSSSISVTYATVEEKSVEGTATILYTGTCGGNVTWTIYDSGVLILSGTGGTTNYNSAKPVPWDSYKNLVSSVVIEEGVASLGDYLFSSHPSLTSVTMSGSVTKIGNNTFSKCKALTAIDIGSGVVSIGKYAFNGDPKLTDVRFAGTENAWKSISFGDNNGVQNASVRFLQ